MDIYGRTVIKRFFRSDNKPPPSSCIQVYKSKTLLLAVMRSFDKAFLLTVNDIWQIWSDNRKTNSWRKMLYFTNVHLRLYHVISTNWLNTIKTSPILPKVLPKDNLHIRHTHCSHLETSFGASELLSWQGPHFDTYLQSLIFNNTKALYSQMGDKLYIHRCCSTAWLSGYNVPLFTQSPLGETG